MCSCAHAVQETFFPLHFLVSQVHYSHCVCIAACDCLMTFIVYTTYMGALSFYSARFSSPTDICNEPEHNYVLAFPPHTSNEAKNPNPNAFPHDLALSHSGLHVCPACNALLLYPCTARSTVWCHRSHSACTGIITMHQCYSTLEFCGYS